MQTLTHIFKQHKLPLFVLVGAILFSSSLTLLAAPADSVPLSGITGSISPSTSDHGDNPQSWSWNTLSSNSALTLTSNSTSATNNSQTLLNIALGGVNASSVAQTTYGAKIVNSHRGGSNSNGVITLPTSPKSTLQTQGSESQPNHTIIRGTYAYVSNTTTGPTEGIEIIDISNPQSPASKGFFQGEASYFPNFDISGSYIYAVSFLKNNIKIIDISNPSSPKLISKTPTGAAPNNVVVRRNYAYVTTASNISPLGGSLQIFNISNPNSPTLVRTINIPRITDIETQGDYLYLLSSGSNLLQSYSLSNPESPALAGALIVNKGVTLSISGIYAYIGTIEGTGGSVKVVNIANPQSPSLTSSLSLPSGYATKLFATPTHVVAGSSEDSKAFYLISMTNPLVPTLVGAVAGQGRAFGISLEDSYVYLSTQTGKAFNVFDLAQIRTQTNANNIALSLSSLNGTNNYALVIPQGSVGIGTEQPQSLFSVGTSSQFQINDTGNIIKLNNVATSFPSTQGQSNTYLKNDGSGNLSWAEVRSGGGGSNSLSALTAGTTSNTIDSTDFPQTWNWNTLSSNTGLTLSSNSTVATGNTQTLLNVALSGASTNNNQTTYGARIANTHTGGSTTSSTPVVPGGAVSTTSTASNSGLYGIVVQGNYLYSCTGDSIFKIYDISNPASPTVSGSLNESCSGLFKVGNYVYIVNPLAPSSTQRLKIIDVSNPASPVLVGFSLANGGPVAVSVRNNYAYTVNQASNLFEVFDISNPASPSSVATLAIGQTSQDIFIQENYAYVTNAASGTASLRVINISNPLSPTLAGIITPSGTSAMSRLFVSGNYAYVTRTSGNINSLQIFNISNPTSPTLTGTLTEVNPGDVFVSGNYAFVTQQNSESIELVDVSNPALPVSLGTVATGQTGIGPIDFLNGYVYVSNIISSNTLQIFNFFPTTTANAINVGLSVGASGGTSNYALIAPTGNVGIGNGAPTGLFSVGTSSQFQVNSSGNIQTSGTLTLSGLTTDNAGGSDKYLCITTAGQVVTRGTTCGGSSKRFKHDITKLQNGLSTITQLNPVSFRYNQTNELRLGLIAEEVKNIDPRLVYLELDGVTVKGVNYQDIIPLLINSTKELNTRLTNLENLIIKKTLTVKDLIADTVTAKKGKFEELELKDKATGDMYCITVTNGTLENSKGECVSK